MAKKAIEKVDANNDKMMNRREFHDLMNKNRIRNPAVGSGDRAFTSLDKNKVVLVHVLLSYVVW